MTSDSLPNLAMPRLAQGVPDHDHRPDAVEGRWRQCEQHPHREQHLRALVRIGRILRTELRGGCETFSFARGERSARRRSSGKTIG
ncbi:MAG: hypothetical protein DRH23_03370 [Deltaproteobacteria bacterium]|nr:MAG: hypothetical protein DRH23_03370 [Deltaproteobacteria bacterium]